MLPVVLSCVLNISGLRARFTQHGWHLGERNMWEKKGLDELDSRIPLLIRVPWMHAASSGVRTSAFAEAVDWMPTLIELAGLPPCVELGDTNGVSLVPVLRDPPLNGTGVKRYAFSQFPRCNCTYESSALDTLNGTCVSEYENLWTNQTRYSSSPRSQSPRLI